MVTIQEPYTNRIGTLKEFRPNLRLRSAVSNHKVKRDRMILLGGMLFMNKYSNTSTK